MNQQSDTPGPMQQVRSLAGLAGLLCSTLAVTLEVFLHKPHSFGKRYLGLQAAAAMLVILAFPVFWPGHNAGPLLIFLACYMAMCLVIRISVLLRRPGGGQPHTYYTGTPYIMRFTGRMRENTVKCQVEPLLMIVVSALMAAVSEVLGAYLLTATFGLMASTNLSVGANRQRTLDMHDAAIESQQRAEDFRAMRDE